MTRKGASQIMTQLLFVLIILVTAVIIIVAFTKGAKGGESIIGNKDTSSGKNQSKTDYCTTKCTEAPTSEACMTAKDPQIGDQTCRQYLDNLARTIYADYPHTVGVGVNTIIIALKDKGTPISGASINGIDGFFEDPSGSGNYKGTIDTTKIKSGFVSLTASVPLSPGKPAYPSVPITILIDEKAPVITDTGDGGGGGGGGGGTGDNGIVLIFEGKEVSSITYKNNVETTVMIRDAAGTNPPKFVSHDGLKQGGTPIECGLNKDMACITQSNGPVWNLLFVPKYALRDGTYTVDINAEKNDGTKLTRTVPFVWKCPAIVLDPAKPFGPGNEMAATFESTVLSDLGAIVVKINTNDIPVTLDHAEAGVITFTLPKVGDPSPTVREGANTLLIERNGEGLCIKNDAHTHYDDKVINYLEKSYPYTCPAKGCYDAFVLTDKISSGGTRDTKTGCSYTTKAPTACPLGCKEGKCDAPDIKITAAYIDDLPLTGSFTTYEGSHILKVTVKNVGTMTAYELVTGNGVTATLGGTELMLISTDDSFNTLDKEASRNYSFAIPAGTPAVPDGQSSVTATLSVSATGSYEAGGELIDYNPLDNTKTYGLNVLKAYFSQNFNNIHALEDWTENGWKIFCNADGESCGLSNIYGGFASNGATTTELISPSISLAGATTVKLSFKWRTPMPNKKLTVSVSYGANKCAAPISRTSTASSTDWKSEKVDISGCAGKSVHVKFVSEDTVYWGIDEITLASQ